MSDKTSMQVFRDIYQVTGHRLWLRPGEQLQKVQVTEDTVGVLIRTVKAQERRVGFRVTAAGTRLISFSREGHTWVCTGVITIWDENFTPYEVGTLGGLSPVEYHDKRRWEDDCFRPGNGTRLGQRDSADRAFQGYDYKNPLFYTTQSEVKS